MMKFLIYSVFLYCACATLSMEQYMEQDKLHTPDGFIRALKDLESSMDQQVKEPTQGAIFRWEREVHSPKYQISMNALMSLWGYSMYSPIGGDPAEEIDLAWFKSKEPFVRMLVASFYICITAEETTRIPPYASLAAHFAEHEEKDRVQEIAFIYVHRKSIGPILAKLLSKATIKPWTAEVKDYISRYEYWGKGNISIPEVSSGLVTVAEKYDKKAMVYNEDNPRLDITTFFNGLDQQVKNSDEASLDEISSGRIYAMKLSSMLSRDESSSGSAMRLWLINGMEPFIESLWWRSWNPHVRMAVIALYACLEKKESDYKESRFFPTLDRFDPEERAERLQEMKYIYEHRPEIARRLIRFIEKISSVKVLTGHCNCSGNIKNG